MNWNQLISSKRLGQEHYHALRHDDRSEFKRDQDRIIFSAPFRRMQNKTQVFPLPGSVFVHNRLTHSLEVSCVGMSLGNDVARELKKKHPELASTLFEEIGTIVSTACLAHDMGNPPFGHSGEKAIQAFFLEGNGRSLKDQVNPGFWDDITHFEGNANAFRLLTHQFQGRRKGGFVMTYSVLASVVKYPFASSVANGHGKFGFFSSEREYYERIADELGIIRFSEKGDASRYARHPLVYLVEAADDICYEIMDIEDAHKLKILGCEEVIRLFTGFFADARVDRMRQVLEAIDDNNEKVAYLRSCVIGELVSECANVFVAHEDDILEGRFDGCLIDHISQRLRVGYENCSKVAWAKIYNSSDVVDIELAGNRIITFLLDRLLDAVLHPEKNYSRLLLSRIPTQYDTANATIYGKVQSVLDHISGMTDVYALDLFRKLNGLSLPAV